MAGNRLYMAGCVVASAGVLLGAATFRAVAPPPCTARVQQALKALESGRYAEAERQGQALATDAVNPTPRAWAIVAAARQRRGRHVAAAEAFRRFLASSTSPAMRKYALAQIRSCERAARKPAPPTAPSKRLGKEELESLARVHDRVYTESSHHFVVRARNPKLAKVLAAEAEVALDRICRAILGGQEYPHSVKINVWADHDDYRAHATDAPEWAGGSFSIFSVNGVIMRKIDLTQRNDRGQFAVIMLDRVLPHEMCHLVLREYFGDATCPLFLDEGLAMLAESEVDNSRIELAGKVVASKARITLASLFVRHRHDIVKPAVFYAESYSFVEFLHGRLTTSQFAAFLRYVKGGCTIADALQRALYLPADESFVPALASAWEDHAVAQAQYLRALRGEEAGIATTLSN